MIDLDKPFKLKYPGDGEGNIIYRIVNFNEITQRCYIEPINLDLPIPPQELVALIDLDNV